MENHNIRADVSLEVNSYSESISLSFIYINDNRKIKMIFTEITLKALPLRRKHPHHISKAKEHIEEAICNLFDNDETGSHYSDLPKLKCIIGQLENVAIYKKRRRYNVITQILAWFILLFTNFFFSRCSHAKK